MLSLLSFTAFPYNVPQVINYGLLDESGIASFSIARKSSFVNVGNVWSDLVLIGQDLMSGEKSIPANSQKFTLDHTDLITEGTSLAGAPGVEIEARLKNNDASYTATNGFDIF